MKSIYSASCAVRLRKLDIWWKARGVGWKGSRTACCRGCVRHSRCRSWIARSGRNHPDSSPAPAGGARSGPYPFSAAGSLVDDRVRGLEQGGDDYLTKPFALAELLARLRNLLKRNSPAAGESTKLHVLDLELDLPQARSISRAENSWQLTQQEFVLLEYLCRNAGRCGNPLP